MRARRRILDRVQLTRERSGVPSRVPGTRVYHSDAPEPSPRLRVAHHERELQKLMFKYEAHPHERTQILQEALGHVAGINHARSLIPEGHQDVARLREYWVGVDLPRNFNARQDAPASDQLARATAHREKLEAARAAAEKTAEAKARANPSKVLEGIRKQGHREIMASKTPAQLTEMYERSIGSFLQMQQHWVKRRDISRAGTFLDQVQLVILKLPAEKQKQWFGQLAKECETARDRFEAEADIQNWMIFTRLAEQNRAAEKGNEAALKTIRSEKGFSSVVEELNRKVRKVVVKIIEPTERDEADLLLQRLMRTMPERMITVLSQHVNKLQRQERAAAARARPVKEVVPIKVAKKKIPTPEPVPELKPPIPPKLKKQQWQRRIKRIKRRPTTFAEELNAAVDAMHPVDKVACRQYVAVSTQAAHLYFKQLRRSEKFPKDSRERKREVRIALNALHASQAAMDMFWQTLGIAPPSYPEFKVRPKL